MATGRRSELQLDQRMLRPDGTSARLTLTLSPLPDTSAPRAVAIVQDVTARRLGEEALRGSELRFRRLIEKLPAAAYTCDADGLITFFNEQAVALWGRAPRLHDPSDRYCGSFKLFSGDGVPIAHERCWMARALHEERDFDGEEILIERPDGTRVAALAHAVGCATRRLVGCVNILIDISERKAPRRGCTKRAPPSSSCGTRGLAWIKDLEGRYPFVNSRRSAPSSSREQLYGRGDQEIPGAHVRQFGENDQKVLSGGKAIENDRDLEAQRRTSFAGEQVPDPRRGWRPA